MNTNCTQCGAPDNDLINGMCSDCCLIVVEATEEKKEK